MIEDIVEYIEENTTVVLVHNGNYYINGLKTKSNETIREYVKTTIEDFKTITNSLETILITELKKRKTVKVEEYKKVLGIFKKKTVKTDYEITPVKMEELYNKKGNAYALVMTMDIEEEFGFKRWYFLAIGEYEQIERIAKYMSSASAIYYLEGLFPKHAVDINRMKRKNYRILKKLKDEMYV